MNRLPGRPSNTQLCCSSSSISLHEKKCRHELTNDTFMLWCFGRNLFQKNCEHFSQDGGAPKQTKQNKTKPRCHYYVIHQRKKRKTSCYLSILYCCKYYLFTYLGFWTVDQTTQSVLTPHRLLGSWTIMMSIWHNFHIVYCSPKMYRIWSYYRLHATMWKSFCEPVFQLQKKVNIKSWWNSYSYVGLEFE